MSDTPLVSIIIPCYNAEKYVAEAIQSALDQTYPNCEVIVIDDGSTDGSLEVIKTFSDRIRYDAGLNRGACAARNRGTELARGGLIKFLDADDLLEITNIESQVNCRGDSRDRIVYGPWAYLIERQGVSSVQTANDQLDPQGDIFTEWLKGRYCVTHALLWPRSVLNRLGGWDESLHANQDGDLFIRAYLHGYELMFCKSEAVLYRRVLSTNKQTISRRRDSMSFQSRLAVFEKVARTLEARGDLDKYAGAVGEVFCCLARAYPDISKQELHACFKRGVKLNGGRIPGGLTHRLAVRLLGVKYKELLSRFVHRFKSQIGQCITQMMSRVRSTRC